MSSMQLYGGLKRHGCPDVPGAFTDSTNEDNWLLFCDEKGELWIQWLCGQHYFVGKRRVYSRKNRFGGTFYQFCRPRLVGEAKAKILCIPADIVKEVLA